MSIMKKHFYPPLQFLLLAAMLCMSIASFAETATPIDGIFYYLNDYDQSAQVTYDPSEDIWSSNPITTYSGALVIPETVTDGVKTYTVKYIGNYAFKNCNSLTSISIPKTVTSIDDNCYLQTLPNLQSITVASDNANYISADNGVLYNKAKTDIICIPAKRGGTYTIPSTVKQVTHCVGRPELDELVIPATVTSLCDGFVMVGWMGSSTVNATIKKLTIEDGTTALSVGTNHGYYTNYSEGFNDENGNYVYCKGMFYRCGIQELYWGRDLTLSNKYSSPFAGNGSMTKVVIGSKVTTVPKYAFVNCWSVQTVDVKGGLAQWCGFDFTAPYTSPFYSAMYGNGTVLFNGAVLVGNVTIPNNVTSIPAHAFQYGCGGVTSVTIHKDVTAIADGAFRGCSMLQNVYLDSGNTTFKVTENVLYDKAGTKIVIYPRLKPGDYVVPSTVTAIGDYQFYGCTKLTAITIPPSVTTLGIAAFDGCTALKDVTIQATTTGLTAKSCVLDQLPVENLYVGRNISSNLYGTDWGDYDDTQSQSLRNVTISNKVTAFPYSFFMGCRKIQKVFFEGTLAEWCNISFANDKATPFGSLKASPILYLDGSPLHSQVLIPDGATKVGSYAFYNQKGVSRITVPSTVKTIEPYAFNAPYVSDVIMKGSAVATLEATSAINDNTTIYVPKSLLSNYRLSPNWSDFADRIFPDGFLQVTVNLTAMSDSPALLPALNALEVEDGEYRITALTNLKIKGTMNGYDFLMIRTKMPNLRHLDLSEVTILDNDGGFEYYTGYHTQEGTISPYTFYNLKNLKTIILPTSITSISYDAFRESGLTEIEIPSNVKTIGSNAFYMCSSLTNLQFHEGLETIEGAAFYNCGITGSLVFPKGLKSIGGSAFYGCYQLGSLVLPTTLKRIEGSAFSYCNNLASIDFAEGLEYIGYSAFESCSNLRELHMPTSLRIIENEAFHWCYGLTEVHVPSMITRIGDRAFRECGLKAVYAYNIKPVQINQDTFDYAGVDLYAPDNSFYAYYVNTQWSQFQDVIEFPAKYTSWYTPRDEDVKIDTNKPIKGESDIHPADGSMEPGSGLIFIGNGVQLVNDLVMNWQHGTNYPTLIANDGLNVNMLKFIMNVYPGRWYFFSFPFDVKLSDVTMDGKWVWRYYDGEARATNGSGGWKNVTGEYLKANVGYIFQCNTEGDLHLPVCAPDFSEADQNKDVALQTHSSANAQDASWNFIGNPQTSYYGLENLDNFNAPVTVWDAENNTYNAVMPGDDDYDFHPFEAFFVQTPSGTSEMTFDSDKRETYAQTQTKTEARLAARRARKVNENRMLINLSISDGTTTDRTRVIFNDKNTMDYEAGADASKFMSMATVPQIYTLDGRNLKYAINARPNGNQEVRIGYVATTEGRYTIKSDLLDCYMALKDNETGSVHMLDEGEYTFFSEAGTFDSRFTLIPGYNATGISNKGIDGYDINTVDGGITINGDLSKPVNIYKVNGVKVASLTEAGKVDLTSGTYIVTVSGKATKVLVK